MPGCIPLRRTQSLPTDHQSDVFSKATSIVHHWLSAHVNHGDYVVDATCGNGYDTVLLAELVGESGRVVAVDIQEAALARTRDRLVEAGLLARVSLKRMSHEHILDVLDPEEIQCAVFNLGYLPGADKRLVTAPNATVAAHENLLSRLGPGGVIISTVYTGHAGGKEEAEALYVWATGLDGKQFAVARHEWVNLDGEPPHILIIHRRP